ncbi:hypothetical protein [uncultured Roseobacter sp.]|uniref:hypothetical protein n=1 Tax=uncultured Roseobacter sp. TaxID=114847 RepID=UPI0026378D0F|nr:hypothetical protein [uncultured Roseobacter sp.]
MMRFLQASVVGILLISGPVSAQSELEWLAEFQLKFRDLTSSKCFKELDELRETTLAPDKIPAENLDATIVLTRAIERNCEHIKLISQVVTKQRQINARMDAAGLTRDQAETDARFVDDFAELFDLEHEADGFRVSSDNQFKTAYNMDPGLQDDLLETLLGKKKASGS